MKKEIKKIDLPKFEDGNKIGQGGKKSEVKKSKNIGFYLVAGVLVLTVLIVILCS